MPISGKMYVWNDRAKSVPEESGVYAFYDEDRFLIYIGQSTNLRERFAQYLETGFSKDPRKRETEYYKREFTSKPENRMKELLDEHRQKYGELPMCNLPPELPRKGVVSESGFYFYEDIDKPLHKAAFNLEVFSEKIRQLPVVSLEFHQKRGDFARWIHDVFKETQLAKKIEKIFETGEDLRSELLDALRNPHTAECPTCGTQTNPRKMWKMAGRPSKTGERLQLTIGYYKCPKCNKAFRKAIAKEKIRTS